MERWVSEKYTRRSSEVAIGWPALETSIARAPSPFVAMLPSTRPILSDLADTVNHHLLYIVCLVDPVVLVRLGHLL